MQFKKNKRFKKKLYKIPKILLALVMTLSMFSNNLSNANALEINYQDNGSIIDKQGQYGWAKVGNFTVNGLRAFCLDHVKPTPPNGTSFYEVTYGNERFTKALYYGWEGIEPWSGFKSEKNGIVVTSLALSVIYSGWNSVGGQNQGNRELGVNAFLDYIDSQRLPDDRISFTPKSVTASLSNDKTFQETSWITMNGDNNITVTLQNGVTLIKKDGSEHQNTVTIYGGEQFYLKAPLTVHGQWTTGDIKGNKPDYNPIVLKSSNEALQPVGFLNILHDPTESGGFEVNWLSTGSLKISKQDEDGKFVPNTSFKISYNQDMSDPIGTYTTKADGTVTIDELAPKTIYIQETSVPEHLVLDSKVYNITVKTSDTVTFTANNSYKKGYIQVIKKDIDSGKTVVASNTTFDIHKQDGSIIGTITTNKQGVATSEILRYGDYYLTEKTAPTGYVQSSEKIQYQVREDGKTYEASFSNKRVVASIELSKEDSATSNVAQGEATLENAIYGLYARENIVEPADGTIIYKADTKVAELVTDEKGQASINNLYLGKYYIKEISAPTGYVLDETEYDIVLNYEGQNVSVVTKNQIVKDRVKAQAFSIIKISDNGSGETDLLQGVEFTVKSQKDIEQYGSWEAAPIAKKAKGQETKVLVTDQNGYAVSDELPYGTYVVRETKAPTDHYTVPDFTVKITEDSREPQPWRVFNDEKFKAVVDMVKQDVDTDKTVALAGTTFKIKNLQTNEYVGYWEWFPLPHYVTEWKTDESGQVFTGDVLNFGDYQIEEIKAPNGYLLNTEPVKFSIRLNGAFETLPDGKTPVVTVRMHDKAVKGQINISKIGEQLVNTTTDVNGNIQFVYENKPLDGATFIVEADENIYSADNQKDLIYAKGQKVAELTTKDGKAQSEHLPLGKYAIYEKTAADGFVVNKEVKKVELTYENQNVPIVFEEVAFENQRQKVDVSVTKKDHDNDTLLKGATFGLYASEDIYSVTNQLLVAKGQLIETVVTDEKGQAGFKADLPINANFEMREIKAPIGYVNTDEVVDIDTIYQGQDKEVISFEPVIINQITKVEISKKDITNNEEIAGAELSIYPKDNKGEIFATWISGQDGRNEDGTIKTHIVQGLEVGRTYILKENIAPYGYAVAQEIEFTVEETGDVQKVEMIDNMVFGQLKWNKKGSIFNEVTIGQTEFGQTHEPLFTESNLLDTEITIYAAQDITIGNHTYYKADEKVQVLESDWEAVLSQKLPVGRYYYVETKVPFGYVQNLDRHYLQKII